MEWFLEMFGEVDRLYEFYEDEDTAEEVINRVEKSIQECEIRGGVANTDDDGSFCMHVTVKDGVKTTSILTDEKWDGETCLGFAMEDPDSYASMADEYGEITITKI